MKNISKKNIIKFSALGFVVLALIFVILFSSGITGFVVQDNSYKVILEAGAFSPKELRIAVGEKVSWENSGEERCDILTHDRSLNVESLEPGKSYVYTFEQTGDYFYFCKNNPVVEGLIIVR